MEKWKKLIDVTGDYVQRGSILRVPKNFEGNFDWYPDPYTDFMIFDPIAKGAYGLIVISGHKAGLIYLIFPSESIGYEGLGLQRSWLLENWKKWVYPDGVLEEVWICEPKAIEFLDSN